MGDNLGECAVIVVVNQLATVILRALHTEITARQSYRAAQAVVAHIPTLAREALLPGCAAGFGGLTAEELRSCADQIATRPWREHSAPSKRGEMDLLCVALRAAADALDPPAPPEPSVEDLRSSAKFMRRYAESNNDKGYLAVAALLDRLADEKERG